MGKKSSPLRANTFRQETPKEEQENPDVKKTGKPDKPARKKKPEKPA